MASASLAGFSMTGWNSTSFRPQLPLPPVVYPPCFGKGCTFRYFMQSKILTLAFLILGIAFFVSFVCAFLPFWFTLEFNIMDSTFGSEGLRQLKKDMGIFFYSDRMTNMLFLEKVTNRVVVPWTFKVAQVTELLSVAVVFCSCAGAGILAFRKYSSVTGALFLAALSTLGAVGQILMVVFSFITLLSSTNDICEPNMRNCQYTDNLVWRNLPFHEQRYRVNQHTTPLIAANWGLYIAIIGAVLSIGGCILMWVEGLMVCRTVNGIRYRQLREKRDVHENERPPTDYIYSPPAARGPPANYGMHQPAHRPPPQPMYRPPPSFSGASSTSESAFVSREVDL